MRIDVVSIFPDYLAPLELSLAGKARTRGLLDVHVQRLATIANGDGVCTTFIPSGKAPTR